MGCGGGGGGGGLGCGGGGGVGGGGDGESEAGGRREGGGSGCTAGGNERAICRVGRCVIRGHQASSELTTWRVGRNGGCGCEYAVVADAVCRVRHQCRAPIRAPSRAHGGGGGGGGGGSAWPFGSGDGGWLSSSGRFGGAPWRASGDRRRGGLGQVHPARRPHRGARGNARIGPCAWLARLRRAAPLHPKRLRA